MPANPLNPEQLAEAARLKALFKKWQDEQRDAGRRISQEAAAEKLGFGQSALSQYLNGKIPLNLPAVLKFSEALGVSPETISPTLVRQFKGLAPSSTTRPDEPGELERAYAGEERRTRSGRRRVESIPESDEIPGAVRIRKVKLHLSAGISGFTADVIEEDDNPIYFRETWLERRGYKREDLIAIPVHGHSMEPLLYDGDTVVVNTADTDPKDGEVYAVNYEGEDVVKRIMRDYGSWWLVSDNLDQRRYPRKQCANEMCIIIGKVVHRQSERF